LNSEGCFLLNLQGMLTSHSIHTQVPRDNKSNSHLKPLNSIRLDIQQAPVTCHPTSNSSQAINMFSSLHSTPHSPAICGTEIDEPLPWRINIRARRQ
jgi:hypothetical protein